MPLKLLPIFVAIALPAGAIQPGPGQRPLDGWGKAVDPEGDCRFENLRGRLIITVPGSKKPHDLSPEMGNTTAPRMVKPVPGDFVIQVRVDGEFEPGDESTQAGRTGYTGAGLVVFADEKNFVRIERATLHAVGVHR